MSTMTTPAETGTSEEQDLEPEPSGAADLFGQLFDPNVWRNPYPLYAELRRSAPISPVDKHLWVVSSHALVQSVLRSQSVSIDERNATLRADAPADYHKAFENVMLFMDPPDHTRLRKLMVRAFTPRQVSSLRPLAASLVTELLDQATPGAFDVVEDLAQPLAVRIICELLGIPYADHGLFTEWGGHLARLLDPSVLRTPEQDEEAGRAAAALRLYLRELIPKRKEQPGTDLLSQMIAVEEEGDRLSFDELVAASLLLLVAGFETTVNLIGTGTVALVEHREQFELLRHDESLLSGAVNEMLRYDSPVQMTLRVAMEPLQIGDAMVAPGDTLVCFLGAANRDPGVFDRPDDFDARRDHNPHLAFGGGIHYCLGASLARMEAEEAFRGLCRRSPALRFAAQPELRPTFTLRGYERLLIE